MTIEGSSARDRLLAAARVRLRQVGATGDPTVLRTPSARADLDALLALFADGRRDVEVGYRLGWLLLLNGLGDGDDALIDTVADGFALCLLAGVEDLPAALLPAVASVAEEAAGALLDQAMSSPDRALLDLAVEQHRRLVKATPADHAGRPERLHRLGNALHRRFELWHAEEDLTAALVARRESIDITPRGDPELSIRLSGLAGVLWSRHQLKGDTADLDAAVDTVRAAGEMAPAGSSHRAMCLSNLGLTLRDRFGRSGDPADLDEAIAAGRQAWELTPPDDPYRSQRLQNLVGHLVIRYREVEGGEAMAEAVAGLSATAPADLATIAFLAGSDDIPAEVASDVAGLAAGLTIGRGLHVVNVYDPVAHEAVVALWRRILGITPAGDPDRHIYLANLSGMLLFRHRTAGTPTDLAAALETARLAVRAAPEGDPDRGLGLGNLAASLGARYRLEGAAEDLELAVDVLRDATDRLPHGHGHRARLLSDLGAMLAELFRLHEDPADLDGAITALRESTRSVPGDPMGRGLALNNLGESLHLRYTRTGAQDDLEEAITTLRVAVETTPPEHSAHVLCLSSLGAALTDRFERSGIRRDLDEATRVLRAAVAAAPTGSQDRTRSLVNLANAVHRRLHTADSRAADADKAVTLAREALASTPADSAAQHQCRSLLANSLRLRFDRHGDPPDLAEAVSLGGGFLHGAPAGVPADRVEQLTAGASALFAAHTFSDPSSDLDAVIDAQRKALRSLAPGNTNRPIALHHLALTLVVRGTHTHSEADLNAAIDAQRSAVTEAGPTHADRVMLLNALGCYLLSRHTLLGARADLDEAIGILAAAAEAAAAGHPGRQGVLPNWCEALLLRAEATEAEAAVAADLDAAVAIAQEAVDAATDRSPRRPWLLGQLGRALLFRYRAQNSPTDLHAALAVLRQAEAIRTEGVDRLVVLQHLAEALHARFERYGDPADLDTAVDLSTRLVSSPTAPPMMRLMAALTAGRLVARDDPARAVDFYETAVELFPRIAPRRLRRSEQQRFLGAFAGLAPNAAAAALSEPGRSADERAARALRLLETGRGVLIGQALDAWSDLAPLRARHPELAARFEELRDLLDRPDDGADALLGGFTLPGPEGAATVDRHRLADEFTTVLARIRQSEGFATFGLPPSVEELRSAARDGAVVVLNVTVPRCDALLVTREGITSVPLPGLTLENATQAGVACQAHAHDSTGPDENLRAKAQEGLSEILAWLWDVVAEPVLDALGHDRVPMDGALPRVWWVPSGPLGMLPFHAAGYHDGSGRAVLDRVVSSCSPTVRALHHARRPLPAALAPGRPLVVAMPTTPGLSPLDFAADEAEVFEEHMGPATVLLAPERPPTRDDVLELLPGSPVVHFACHGDSWDEDPSRHRLLLHDHADTPLTVEELASVRLDHARLAYLSACETAVSYDGQLADEAMHLTSAFQLCGFRHVIGTLWPVVDDTAAEMAEVFYTGLRSDAGTPDPDRSPYALHAAIRELRARLPRTPSLWASHVHSGA